MVSSIQTPTCTLSINKRTGNLIAALVVNDNMPAIIKDVKRISAAQLSNITFCNSVSGYTDNELRERNRALHLSTVMGCYAKSSVKLVISTVDGYKELSAAIWGSTEKHILINGGNFIPVEAVAWVSAEAA